MDKRALIMGALFAAACGAPGDLSPDAVQNIPDGDATGSALSGTYDIEIRVTECSGSCGPFSVGIFSASVCDVGDTESGRVEVTQADGRLVIDTDELPSRFEGGAYADGSFDVGGYATQFGGELQITARSLGQIHADGTLESTIRSRSWGEVEGNDADCVGVREVTGVRED